MMASHADADDVQKQIDDDDSCYDTDDDEWGNNYVNLSKESLARIKSNDPQITYLMLGWASVVRRDDLRASSVDWKKEGTHIGRNTHLKKLCIYGFGENEYCYEGEVNNFKSFCRDAFNNRSIESLEISESCIPDQGLFNDISTFIEQNDNLRELRFWWCDIGEESARLLAKSLSARRNKESLAKIAIDCYIDEHVAESLMCALNGYGNVVSLQVTDTMFGRGKQISDRLQSSHCKLKKLAFSGAVKFDNDNGAKILGEALAINRTLQILDLSSYCGITDEGATSLCNGLNNNVTLRSLDLGHNPSITSVGWCAIAACLQNPNSALNELVASCCNIGDEALACFGNSLANNTALFSLDMSKENSATSAGWQNFSLCLQSPSSVLACLNLTGCTGVDNNAVNAFAGSLANNSSLHSLYLEKDGIIWSWEAFLPVLFDASSIQSTYTSNHTLESINGYWNANSRLQILSPYLEMNRNSNKAEVARQKILQAHFADGEVDIQEFKDMKVQVLPRLISWFGKDGTNTSLLFGLLRGMPSTISGVDNRECLVDSNV